MAIRMPWLIREPVIRHNFSADKSFQGQGRQHVETKTSADRERAIDGDLVIAGLQASNVDRHVVRRKVVQDIALGFVAKAQESCDCHG